MPYVSTGPNVLAMVEAKQKAAFAWMRCWVAIESSTRARVGERRLWMNMGRYVQWRMLADGWSKEKALQDWHVQKETLPKGCVSADGI